MTEREERHRVRRRKRRRRADSGEMIVPWPDEAEERGEGASPWILWGVVALGALLLLTILEWVGTQ